MSDHINDHIGRATGEQDDDCESRLNAQTYRLIEEQDVHRESLRRITLLENENARLRAALQKAADRLYVHQGATTKALVAEIQALLAEPQPAATQQPKGGGE